MSPVKELIVLHFGDNSKAFIKSMNVAKLWLDMLYPKRGHHGGTTNSGHPQLFTLYEDDEDDEIEQISVKQVEENCSNLHDVSPSCSSSTDVPDQTSGPHEAWKHDMSELLQKAELLKGASSHLQSMLEANTHSVNHNFEKMERVFKQSLQSQSAAVQCSVDELKCWLASQGNSCADQLQTADLLKGENNKLQSMLEAMTHSVKQDLENMEGNFKQTFQDQGAALKGAVNEVFCWLESQRCTCEDRLKHDALEKALEIVNLLKDTNWQVMSSDQISASLVQKELGNTDVRWQSFKQLDGQMPNQMVTTNAEAGHQKNNIELEPKMNRDTCWGEHDADDLKETYLDWLANLRRKDDKT